MTLVDRDARTVLAAARRALGPSQEQRDRARARILTAIGAGIGAGLGITATASAGVGAKGAAAGSSAALAGTLGYTGASAGGAGAGAAVAGAATKAAAMGTSLVVAKWVAGGFLVAVTGATAMVGSRQLSHTPSLPRAVPTIVSHAPRATHLSMPPAAPGSGVAAATETRPTAAKPATLLPTAGHVEPGPDEPAQPAIAEELQVVRGADAALRAGQPARALELLGEAQRRFAGGELAEEREALAILAECKLDPPSGAVQARRFIGLKPRSVHVETIVDACHLGEPSAPPAADAPKPSRLPLAPSGDNGRFDDIDAP